MFWILLGFFGLVSLTVFDLLQRKHAIRRNFPVIGHFRYWFESVGPELRQYIVTGNDEERPFNRDQRRWVYASSKKENNYFGFGTDNELELSGNYLIIKHAPFPFPAPAREDESFGDQYPLPCAKVLGSARKRAKAFRPASVVNVSGMSFGSLSAPAVEALNRGCEKANCLHNTGEGGVSPHHLHGGDLVWQIGTGYFGCRDRDGRFSLQRFLETVALNPVKAIEIKLSQGAKPGLGGVLPSQKITPDIAQIRGIPMGKDCISPSHHSAFHDVDSLLDFVEMLADESGLPVGIKSAVGQIDFWRSLAGQMASKSRGVDFVTIDGGEGGTGAAPLVFSDHVSLPLKVAFSQVYAEFAKASIQDKVVFIGAGKLGFPETAAFGCALGCDLINVGRTAMLALGCIQAQRCHTGHCPTGVATQNRWLARGLDAKLKAERLANYIVILRKGLTQLSHACGVSHPAKLSLDHFDILDNRYDARPAREVFEYEAHWGVPKDALASP